ncbi:MAG: class I SAM-dependent methyltransferase [Burkholderiales bacterium]|nr:class I SAM-dependent methyltransferase [Burkholderiales bacterium]
MSGPAMLAHLLLEKFSGGGLLRIAEPELVMGDEGRNEAFERMGREDGLLAFLHLYQSIQISSLVKPGEKVLDLGCGPASQLVQIARLNPEAHFLGLDASSEMLRRGGEAVKRSGVGNVDFIAGDMTRLDGLADASFDCVISTMSLHHLPDTEALFSTFRAVRRVLKPGGGVYLIDFGRLKRAATQRFFAEDRILEQPESFTIDYFNSLRAAFSVEELCRAILPLGEGIGKRQTALAPFMVVFRNAARREPDPSARSAAGKIYANLNRIQQKDFRLYARWLKAGGLDLPFQPFPVRSFRR